ncbi:TonB-dependent siderophore receptor [Marinomonas mediterranea]|uniref:TonB-dependent siderophore receptor n=1 Tax=Marinomonas mediterranea (strain ATCC 700492 / JCM 21426 / NBRC 103028 / MMB-1) TaxID=717774 RepID=F2JZB8_MARM1|nr:TonB-dependent siderophore receptor [Marinomonas mediterranea]ADZ93203.1 TonB-dependent siderophore receptor [Marinomonas mediterranea MMB-1]WCN15157.1 TonB-dependent siderophore receptor [Marinomonas mediterranea]WCN19201.1 TonB-dependent siderophore receptor [Marinomonas mediterranea MMB-1]
MNRSAPFLPSLVAIAVASVSSNLVFAAEGEEHAQSDIALETLTVSGETYRNTATKTKLTSSETPQGISVIDAEALEQQGVESIAEAVRYTSGINTELRGGGVTRLDLFSIRGFQNDQTYYDGLRLLYNDWNLQPQIDVVAIEQVEVFKGPTSTLYGAMPPGGMVNVIGKSPQEEPSHSIEVALGNDEKQELTFDSTGAINDSLNYRVVGLGRSKDGQAETSEEERIMLAPSLDWHVNEKTLVNFNLYYQKDPSMGIYSSLPAKGTVLDNVNGSLSSDAYAGDANWETYEKEVLMAGYKINHSFNDNWSFLQNARFMDATAYQENTYSTGLAADEKTLSRRAYLTDEATKSVTVDNQFSGTFDTGVVEHNLLFGLDYLKLESDIKYEDAAAPSIDLYTPNYYQITRAGLDFAASGYSSDFTIEKEQTGVYLQDQMRAGNWVVIVGGRYDDFESTEKGKKYGADTDTKLTQDAFTGRAGLLYEMESGFSPFISYAESFEAESGSDKDGNKFEPSEAQQIEAGFKFSGKNTLATVSLYEITKQKVKTRDPNGTAYDQIQVGEVRSRGVEIDLTQNLTDALDMRMAVTKQEVEVTKDNSGIQGNTPIWVPETTAAVWLNYNSIEGLFEGAGLGLGVRYIGKMQMDSANTETVPSATLVDASIGYDLGMFSTELEGASIQLSVTNLMDETYYSCYDTNNCWYGDERAYEVSARYDF